MSTGKSLCSLFFKQHAAANTSLRRQKLVPAGFKHMVDTLHASRKFRPFVATMLMAWVNEEGKLAFEWQVIFSSDTATYRLHSQQG